MFVQLLFLKLQLRSLFLSLFLLAHNCKQGVCIDSSCSRLDTNQNISKGDIYTTSRAKSIVTLAARCADSSGCFGCFLFFLEEKNPIPTLRTKPLHFFCTPLWLLHITAWWNVKWNAIRSVSLFFFSTFECLLDLKEHPGEWKTSMKRLRERPWVFPSGVIRTKKCGASEK